jgi:glycosyltransferase involved in cell wall biosynthesis
MKEIIQVLAKFKSEKFHLFITGSINKNHYVNEVIELTQKMLPGKVSMTGYVTNEELREIYSISDLMLSYSISEGGPFSIFQAYLMEVPVIQSSVGIASEMALQYKVSRLVDPFHHIELEKAISDYFLGVIPSTLERGIAENYFSWNRIAKYYFEIFSLSYNRKY